MKKQVIALVVVLAAGVAASFALAAPPPGKGPQTSSSTSPGKSGKGAKCRPLNLKGTVVGGTVALNVTKASGPKGKGLVGTTANLMVSGKVTVQAWDCSAAGSTTTAPLLKLRQLHVGGSPQAQTTTTP